MNCRKCLIELSKENCCPSFLERGFNICRTCENNRVKLFNIKNRKLIISNLGGKCECCGIDNSDLLSIDHINGNGIEDRHSFKKWKTYLKTLAEMPIDQLKLKYQALCYNCNYTKGFWGICPHQFNKLTDSKIKSVLNTLPISNRGVKKTHLSNDKRKIRKNNMKKLRRIIRKLEMILAYGEKCVNCSETHPMFLVLDHINDNGCLEIGEKGTDFYQYLKTLGYPGNGTQLQLLCHNCNAHKEYILNRGVNIKQTIKIDKNVYIKKDYDITKEQKLILYNNAKYLFAQITASQDLTH